MELDLKLLENPDEKEIALRQIALEEAENNLANIEKKLSKTVVYAEFDGIVLEQNIKPGMMVTPGTLLLRVGDLSDLQIEISVNEYDAAKLRLGQKAIISGQGFGDRTYDGEVVKIAPSASVTQTSRGNESVVKAAVRVIEHDGQIKPGFSATVEITVDEKQDAILIPLECVIEEEGSKQVMVVKDGNISKREVRTGLENDLYVEIVQGLSEGDEVLQDPSQGSDVTGDAL
ncbi:MAG: efflux RND transporter periplasmic adaptor subunit [Tepidanaerobacteraceae bacterium]